MSVKTARITAEQATEKYVAAVSRQHVPSNRRRLERRFVRRVQHRFTTAQKLIVAERLGLKPEEML